MYRVSPESCDEGIKIREVRSASSVDLLACRSNVIDDSSEKKGPLDVQAEGVGVFGGMESENEVGGVPELGSWRWRSLKGVKGKARGRKVRRET